MTKAQEETLRSKQVDKDLEEFFALAPNSIGREIRALFYMQFERFLRSERGNLNAQILNHWFFHFQNYLMIEDDCKDGKPTEIDYRRPEIKSWIAEVEEMIKNDLNNENREKKPGSSHAFIGEDRRK